jgi:hypothetical protein
VISNKTTKATAKGRMLAKAINIIPSTTLFA